MLFLFCLQVVHIKRFRFSTTSREKLSTDVHFPLSGLDLKPYLSSDLHHIRHAAVPNVLFRSLSISIHSNNNHDEEEMPVQTSTGASNRDQVMTFSPTPSPPKSTKKSQQGLQSTSSLTNFIDSPQQLAQATSTPSTGAPTKSYDVKSMIHHHCEPVYDLISVSNHHGNLNGGHYIAHVDTNYGRKSEKNPRWMCFNDARVSNASSTSIAGPTAYVLFYRLREEPCSYYEDNHSGRVSSRDEHT
jgi:hypothetical protein